MIELTDPSKESSWDDRETEVRWAIIDSDNDEEEVKARTLAKKVIESVNEPSYKIISETTKYLQVLFSAIVTISEQLLCQNDQFWKYMLRGPDLH